MSRSSSTSPSDAWIVAIVVAIVGLAATQPRLERTSAPRQAAAPTGIAARCAANDSATELCREAHRAHVTDFDSSSTP